MFTNIKAKIAGYEASLPLTAAQVTRVELICDTFISVYNFVEQSRATMQQLTDWQDLIFTADGGKPGDPIPAAPDFQDYTPKPGAFVGIFQEFRQLRDFIVAAPGYNHGVGEDLMIVAPEAEETDLSSLAPELKVTSPATGNKVRVEGSLQGASALRVDYQRKGAGAWLLVTILTKLPAEFTIAPQTPGEAETGVIRAVLMDKNEEIGNFSPLYPVTIS
jgi:hypothetical protein